MSETSSSPAPVCLFAFNRPSHTVRTLAALQANKLAADTELYGFLDGPRNSSEVARVEEVASVIARQSGFRAIHLSRRDQNAGLARSIIDGTTAVMQHHGRAIVLEDDIVTSPAFLEYMNHALDAYEDHPEVWHVAGYNEPFSEEHIPRDPILWRFMSCWGWASWADRWARFRKEPQALIDRFSEENIRLFNLDDAHDFWGQVRANAKGEINTWAVFWYATIFEHGGLCLSPYLSYTENIGFDGSGTHCGDTLRPQRRTLNLDPKPQLPMRFSEDAVAIERLRAHYLYKPKGIAKLKREWYRLIRKAVRRGGGN